MSPISKIFIANRGEIALRIIRACRELGIESVVGVSEADQDSLPAKMADRAVCIGPARAQESYLKVETIVCAALGTGADAIHPGYGFLAEQPDLSRICKEHGLAFIGPPEKCIKEMGNKLLARKMVSDQGVPVIPGSGNVRNVTEAVEAASEIGFPVIMKAAAGGGGRGIKIVRNAGELQEVFDTSSAEARVAFGDDALYIEKYIPLARHIEVQILADQMGNVIHLGERDCSLQRRYQKMIEEAPAPFLSEDLRQEIRRAGVSIARSIGYQSAGTVEFILDKKTNKFYFLEMNTRIQVEHPVTEMITGIDIVQEQIRVAAGRPLSLSQENVTLAGHAIECRLTAEDPERNFLPMPGRLLDWECPEGEGIRVDTHCFPGYSVPPFYDSLLAKVITKGEDREEAVQRMKHALGNFVVRGIHTVIPFLLFVLNREEYRNGDVHTNWMESVLEQAYSRK
ncbi:MAG: acetyl-CoA carboxylase biotin carboxylase subunit [Acidobacteriia bacterium]|nr:acetyl-CoA carboxylase biotin carboxylase subunit [Terriglobia bacterium]